MLNVKSGMYVNLTKTMVLRRGGGGIEKILEMFFGGGQKLELVLFYQYLGLIFSPKLKWTKRTPIALQAEN